MRNNNINIKKFTKFLKNYGAEILPNTNEFELLRFKGKETGVLYKSGKTSNNYTQNAINCFIMNKTWDGKPVSVGRKTTYKKEKIAILERDGSNCFYCDKPLSDDITIEHLIPLSGGGKNTLSNMVLAHEKCNNDVGNLTIVEKIKIVIKNRSL